MLPRPISLSTSIRPPWLSTIDLVMLSPRPTPWIDCSSACRARKKRVNSRSRSRGLDADAGVADGELDPVAVDEQPDADLAAAGAVLDRVREQVVDDLRHPLRVDQQVQTLGDVHLEPDAGRLGGGRGRDRGVPHDLHQVVRRPDHLQRPLVDLGGLQQVGDQPLEPVGVAGHDARAA